jgi:DNA-binding response OmpR family regulator
MVKRILVVDDHVPTRTLIRNVLERERNERIEVVEAGTGKECLKAFDQQGPFNLVLLDVGLPDVDGFTLCRGLRNVDTDVPIVFVTGKTELKDFNEGRQAGGDSYLVKPISRAALRSLVGLFTGVPRSKAKKA